WTTMAGEDRSPAIFSATKLRPKCSTPKHTHTANRRGHWPGAGRLSQNSSGRPSAMNRSAVNRNGGISRSAEAEVRKLPAQATQTSSPGEEARGHQAQA